MRSPYYEMDSSKAYSISQSSADTLLSPEPQLRSRSAPTSTRCGRWRSVKVLVLGHLALCALNIILDYTLWHVYRFGDHGSAWGSRVALFRAADWPVIGANGTASLESQSKQRPTLQVGSLYMRGATHGYDAFPHASANVHNADPSTVFIVDGMKPTSKLGNVYKRNGKSLTISAGALRQYLKAMVWVTSAETVKTELQKSIARLSGSTFGFLTFGWILGGIAQTFGGMAIRWYCDTTTWAQSASRPSSASASLSLSSSRGAFGAQVGCALNGIPKSLFWNGARRQWDRRRDRYSV